MNALDLVFLVYNNPFVKAVLGLMAANVFIGIAKALYLKDFRLGELADWLMSRAVPYLIGAGAVQLVLMTVPEQWSGVGQAAGTTVWLFVCASLVGKILDSLREMGMPVPRALTDRTKPDVTATP